MAKVLALSSFVASGSVGLRAAMAAMAASRVELIAVPTVILSNHPGHKNFAGAATPVPQLFDMLGAFEANGALKAIDGVLIGYLPSPAHVALAYTAVTRVKALNPSAIIVVDPVLGDDPDGLYIDASAAMAIKDSLAAIADIITPNRFELAFLSGCDVVDAASALSAATRLKAEYVAATSIPFDAERVGNLLRGAGGARLATVPKSAHAPHGTGDLFASVLLAKRVQGADLASAWAAAVALCEHAIAISGAADDLALELLDWSRPLASPCVVLETTA
ncbi:MAG: bifunctional hydroxymethylpyrimidine kinase/phosphomethylpyrimidine kinase [Hyphomicrobium sp.]|nr:bifunctional hydroxymethylpyrimidine kinase/phosphomethylpyrimidine kinase [Hyphomicrobium sp.]